MTEAEAEAQLARLLEADTDPALTDEDMEDLLINAARPDAQGLTRADANWEPTWDLNAAAADGWLRKASKAVSRFSFAEDGQRFERAQIYAHCIRMQEMYARKAMGTLSAESYFGITD
jgi:hypothetical protein